MGSLLYLISIFSTYNVELNNSYLTAVSETKDVGIEVEFSAIPHLSVGDPVFFKGQLVGSISKVGIPNLNSDDQLDSKPSTVSIKLTDLTVPVSDQLVGLVAKIKVPVVADSKPSLRSALELIQVSSSPTANHEDKLKLHGFISFEEFWNSSSKVMPLG